MRRPVECILTLVVVGVAAGFSADAATVKIADATAIPGWTPEYVGIVLSVGGGESVAGIQFDLLYNPAAVAYHNCVAGGVALAADKSVSVSLLEPGRLRVLVTGFNLNAMGSGTVGGLYLSLLEGVYSAPESLTPTGVVLSDPYGTAIASSEVAGSLIPDPQPLPTGTERPGMILAIVIVLGMLGTARMRVRSCV